MTKREFLLQLNDALGAMNEDERSAAVKYYSDYIDDAGEDMEKVLRQLGTPQQVAASILAEAGVEPNANAAAGPYQEEKQRPAQPTVQKRPMPTWAVVVLVIVLSPFWLTILGTVASVVIGAVGLFFGLFVGVAALLVGGLLCAGLGLYLMVAEPAAGVVALGTGLCFLGAGLLGVVLCVFLCSKVLPAVMGWLRQLWKKLFGKRKEDF